ncbi:unnamed protein product [Mytilus coruscus]|uniref:CCHC-type domain-containing protein n=1 Tax=Mytilus coruscus TaxID=42192 RepID=A0A6J8AZY3_MYTCO|nr:unnamed protein product [Mytilus coruscus]
MKQVVEGLAQVAQAMSNKPTNRYNSDKNTGTNRNTEGSLCWYHKSDNHEIGDCSIFARLDSQTKVDLVRKNGGCFSCLKIGHLSRHCHSRKPCDIQNELHQTCGKIHHKNLHTAHIDGISFHNSTQVINDDKNKNGVLLMISSVQCKDMSLTTLWDPGANMSLITHKTAKRLGLSGQDITLSVTKVGNVTEHVQSKKVARKCAIGQSQHSIREERELNIIKSGMTHDEESQQWIVNYPWIKNPNNLPNNVNSAVSRLGSTEKRLLRNSLEYASAYDEQIMDMVKRGIARKLTKEEMEIHSGPVHYIPHHEVLKPESKSTPLRIVFNSSSSYMGHTLNDYWAKGSNVINDLLAVLIRFRQESIALAGDISKMYNAIRLSSLDQHTHRFVWRNLETHRDPDHYALLTVTFGDRPSGAISTLALHQTAKMYQHIYPDASKMVIRNSYVDDILQSVESVDNARFKPSRPRKCLHVEHKNVRKGENITKSQIESSVPTSLTPRMVLSQVASVYDPLGLATPYTLAAKVLMRKLCIENNTNDKTIVISRWDYAMSVESRLEWMDFFKELFDIEQLKFHRCLKPDNAVGDPILVIFSDGSKLAYGTCAYVRWGTAHGGFESRLVIAKNRIAPTKQMSVPRLE